MDTIHRMKALWALTEVRDPPTQGHVHAALLHCRLPSSPVICQYIRAQEAGNPLLMCFPHHTIMPSESPK